MATRNLWGILPETTEHKPPLTILKEQAEVLSHLTKGVLRGDAGMVNEYGRFSLTLSIVAPALDYSYFVLEAKHDIELYPVTVYSVWERNEYATHRRCETEEEFEAAVGEILSSHRVKSVVASLLAQSKAL